MSEGAHDLLVRGIAAAKAGDLKEARFYLEWVLREQPDLSQQIDVWYWLSEISTDPAEKRENLGMILLNDPLNALARRKLAILDGRLDPAEIVDPDRIHAPAPGFTEDVNAKRFVCPTCGGRMTYAPDGRSLVCEYCASRQRINSKSNAGSDGQDFILGMATAKGHLRPVSMHSVACQGCGAVFLSPPQDISLTCPYCGSAEVVEQQETHEWAAPSAVIPFRIDCHEASEIFREWLESNRIEDAHALHSLNSLYLPAWIFVMGGRLIVFNLEQKAGRRFTSMEDAVKTPHVVVLATRRLPEPLEKIADDYILDGLVAYDPAYLADWPAETYQISMGDASLLAREKILNEARAQYQGELLQPEPEIKIDTSQLAVESFQLVLLPVFIAKVTRESKSWTVVINGQSGKVTSQRPLQNMGLSWLDKILR